MKTKYLLPLENAIDDFTISHKHYVLPVHPNIESSSESTNNSIKIVTIRTGGFFYSNSNLQIKKNN